MSPPGRPKGERAPQRASAEGVLIGPPGRPKGERAPQRASAEDSLRIPRATYRVQLHRGFTFRDATAIVPYLSRLGVSHLYTSPFLRARPGSTHGYDVVDHAAINPEIGTEADLAVLVAALRTHGMGLVIDLVPNHMGVLRADNHRWLDVLEHGAASAFADFFDIDWTPAPQATEGRVLVPILADHYGVILERGELALHFDAAAGELSLWYHEHRLPIRPAAYPRVLLADMKTLEARAGVAVAAELRRVADAFAAVPMQAGDERGDAARLAARAKARLAALCARAPAALAHIEARVAAMQGTPDDPRSFDDLDALVAGQAYRLAFWRVAADDINYRRFFDINDLAAVRQERADVFAATHALPLAVVARGDVDGLRIDHPDGLADPEAYFVRLQAAVHRMYVVIEKILAAHERLPAAWPVHGETGYRFMAVVTALFVDPGAASRFTRLYAAATGERRGFDEILRQSKSFVVEHALASDLERLTVLLTRIVKHDRRTCDFSANVLRRALGMLVAAFPVYRTYVGAQGASGDDLRHIDWAVGVARRMSRLDEDSVFDAIARLLRGEWQAPDDSVAALVHDFVCRFQQLTAPAMAKGFEDTALYRYAPLACLNEVGSDPRVFGSTVAAFHRANAVRARDWPHAMLATSTHDSKRGEDVRARLAVLSEMPAAWRLALRRWRQINRRLRVTLDSGVAPSAKDEYLLYQTLLGTWSNDETPDLDAFRMRIQAYMQKAARESKERTSWINVDEAYERALAVFVDGVLATPDPNPFLADFLPLQQRIAHAGCVNGLAQVALKLTAPGMPDVYQGCEAWDLNLVDPDNRRPVDYAWREQALDALAGRQDDADALPRELLDTWRDGRVKLWLTARLLDLRRRHAALFEQGRYAPVRVHGVRRDAVCAYLRSQAGRHVLCVVPRLWQRYASEESRWPLGEAVWADTVVMLPAAAWTSALGGATLRRDAGAAPSAHRVADLLATFPIAVHVSA